MAELVEVFLVPGFLGFESLGRLDYFIDVEDLVANKAGGPSVTVNVHTTQTEPAGSLQRRATKLVDEIADHHSMDAKSVHFVGHSTGGLDVRLLLSPDNAVERQLKVDAAAGDQRAACVLDALEKSRSAVSVATPHFGSPIADLALRLDVDRALRFGSKLLERPLAEDFVALGLRAAGLAAKALQLLPLEPSFLDWVSGEVLSDEPDKVIEYLERATADVGALRNLTQEGTDLANALLVPRKNVRYGSIITGTQKPQGPIDTTDPLLYVNTVLFRLAWWAVARENPDYPYSPASQDIARMHAYDLEAGYDVGELDVTDDTSDGVVPTSSQAHGVILGVFASDHLDCVGHFPHTQSDGTEVTGWVRSGASFNANRFDLMWTRVSDFIASRPRPSLGQPSAGTLGHINP